MENVINESNRMKFLAGIIKESDSDVKTFKFKVKHDGGTKKITTTGSSLEDAKKKIMAAEGCPMSAISLAQ